MTSALTLYQAKSPSKQHISLGLSTIYGVHKPSLSMLAQELLYRIIISILERAYYYVESAFIKHLDATLQRFSEPRQPMPQSRILNELSKQHADTENGTLFYQTNSQKPY